MTKNTLRTIALSLALATGSAGVFHAAHAQATTDNSTQTEQKAGQERHRGFKGHHGPVRHHAFHAGMGHAPLAMLGHLKSKLNLTESQQKLWDAAQGQSREVGQAMRAQREEGIKALRAQADAGPLDLRALTAKHEADRAALKPKMDAARDAWLAAYDSLDAKQKQIVTDAVKKRIERGDRMREHRRPDQPAKN
ncbi:Spy/CpxP family protein refolding chaperone [Pigmentiphaga sp. NML080357]|uniref:Spy/CpxP family protein refolding chaperone n=1 Tax=Pigmentiphaga sp. NML080357 TaxID=2008675 RepID=UPI001303E0A4|nr:Spy/CpxP family protein refolding chaperone [Pigmentiphaga sp. NML080357]